MDFVSAPLLRPGGAVHDVVLEILKSDGDKILRPLLECFNTWTMPIETIEFSLLPPDSLTKLKAWDLTNEALAAAATWAVDVGDQVVHAQVTLSHHFQKLAQAIADMEESFRHLQAQDRVVDRLPTQDMVKKLSAMRCSRSAMLDFLAKNTCSGPSLYGTCLDDVFSTTPLAANIKESTG